MKISEMIRGFKVEAVRIKRKPGDVWLTKGDRWRAMNQSGEMESFTDETYAKAFANSAGSKKSRGTNKKKREEAHQKAIRAILGPISKAINMGLYYVRDLAQRLDQYNLATPAGAKALAFEVQILGRKVGDEERVRNAFIKYLKGIVHPSFKP